MYIFYLDTCTVIWIPFLMHDLFATRKMKKSSNRRPDKVNQFLAKEMDTQENGCNDFLQIHL